MSEEGEQALPQEEYQQSAMIDKGVIARDSEHFPSLGKTIDYSVYIQALPNGYVRQYRVADNACAYDNNKTGDTKNTWAKESPKEPVTAIEMDPNGLRTNWQLGPETKAKFIIHNTPDKPREIKLALYTKPSSAAPAVK